MRDAVEGARVHGPDKGTRLSTVAGACRVRQTGMVPLGGRQAAGPAPSTPPSQGCAFTMPTRHPVPSGPA